MSYTFKANSVNSDIFRHHMIRITISPPKMLVVHCLLRRCGSRPARRSSIPSQISVYSVITR